MLTAIIFIITNCENNPNVHPLINEQNTIYLNNDFLKGMML